MLSGIFQLKTPQDLLDKLRREYERLRLSPMDQDVAFNLFITAEHIADWLYPGDIKSSNYQIRRSLKENNVLLSVCSHVANGSKHFEVNSKKHNSISDTSVHQGSFQRGAFQEDAFQVPQLLIHLEGDAKEKFGNSIEVLKLAGMIVKFWEAKLTVPLSN